MPCRYKPCSPEAVAKKSVVKKSAEARAYEEALSKLVDKETFDRRTTNVFLQYASEEQTSSSITLQRNVQEQFYSSGSYDELIKQGVQFSSVQCKKTLCKIDFNLSNQTESSMDAGFAITQILVENFVNKDGVPKISSRERGGELHFYIGSDALTK